MLGVRTSPVCVGARKPLHRGRVAQVTAMASSVAVKEVPTTPIEGQKTGTSGLRKKAKEFSSGNYLANWVQSLFNALPAEQKVRLPVPAKPMTREVPYLVSPHLRWAPPWFWAATVGGSIRRLRR